MTRNRSNLSTMRKAYDLMEAHYKTIPRHKPEHSFWWHMARKWESDIINYESYNKTVRKHLKRNKFMAAQEGREHNPVYLPGNSDPYRMSLSIIRMLKDK